MIVSTFPRIMQVEGFFVDKDIPIDGSWEFGFHKIIQANQVS